VSILYWATRAAKSRQLAIGLNFAHDPHFATYA